MTTWNAAVPATLPPASLAEKLRGALRLVAFATLTGLCLAVFLVGRALRRWLGRAVVFHFGAARLWARGGLWLMGLRHEVTGRPIARGAMVANHGSWLDVLALRAVRLVTLDDNVVTIPNSKFLTDVVASGNAGELDMLVQMDFFVGLDEDVGVAKRVGGEALASSRYTYLKKPWTIVVSEVQQNDFVAVRLRAKVYVLDVHYEKTLESDVTERVLAAFRHHAIAGPAVLHRAVA